MATFTEIVPEQYLGNVHQSLIEFQGIKLLVGLGWDSKMEMSLDHLIKIAPEIDAILLTHATMSHIGAYAQVAKEFEHVPVFSTLPVQNLGRMVTLDAYRGAGKLGPLDDADITVQDVEAAFDKVLQLKYSEQRVLNGKLEGITITAYNAGHTLGGTIWKIQKDHEDIVYAVDWNHSKDSHLNGAFMQNGSLIDALSKPSVLVCGSNTGQGVALSKRQQRLFDNIKETIHNNGTVLIPTSQARVLELVHILERFWSTEKMQVPLVLLSHVGRRTMSYASSMLEWMSGSIISDWETQNNSPFDTKHLKTVNNISELNRMDGPKVVLATSEALEGFSKLEFREICANDSSMVVLTELSSAHATLTDKLYQLWQTEQGSQGAAALTTKIALRYPVETPLEGSDLENFKKHIKELKAATQLLQAQQHRSEKVLENNEQPVSEDEDDDDDDFENQEAALEMDVLLMDNNVYDYDVRSDDKPPRMFPYSLKRKRVDDYGETIRAEDYMRANEKQVDQQQQQQQQQMSASETKIGEKRTWGGYDKETHRLDVMSDSKDIIPCKMEWAGGEIKVLCKVDYIDFEGLSDERSLSQVVNNVQPKKLILVGEMNQTEFECEAEIATSFDAINAGINSYAYSVKVSGDLEKLLKWQRILGDYQVAHVSGQLIINQDETKQNELIPTDYPVRANQLLVGDIKLAELRRKLITKGHRAEYKAEGILVCDDKVAIRKLDEGRLEIEGGVGDEFYETKSVVRQLLALV